MVELALLLLAACSAGSDSGSKGDSDASTGSTCISEGDDVCDGIDNDCDGVVDEDGATLFYRDEDGDGFGASSVSVLSCEESLPGYVTDFTDCSDVDGTIYPEAPEFCDGRDHDCDGEVYEDGSEDIEPWYSDEDGDGYGSIRHIVEACVGPEGYSASSADCDDDDPYISPRAVEICDDEDVDEDCDGLVDEFDDWAAGGDPYYIDRDGDRYGDAATLPEWLCERPDDYVVNNDDCDDFEASISPSGIESCNTLDDDCDAIVDEDVCPLESVPVPDDSGVLPPDTDDSGTGASGGSDSGSGSSGSGSAGAAPPRAFWSRWW